MFRRIFDPPLPKEERATLSPDLERALLGLTKCSDLPVITLVRCFKLLAGHYRVRFSLAENLLFAVLKKGNALSEFSLNEYCECLEMFTSQEIDVDARNFAALNGESLSIFLQKSFYIENIIQLFGQKAPKGDPILKYTSRLNQSINSIILNFGLREEDVTFKLLSNWIRAFQDAYQHVEGFYIHCLDKQVKRFTRSSRHYNMRREPSLRDVLLHDIRRLPFGRLENEILQVIRYCEAQAKNKEVSIHDLV